MVGVISVADLSFTYPGTTSRAVTGMTFDVDENEIFGLLGPSGAGKSTTQNILIGLLEGWRGQVTVRGRSLRDWGREYFHHIGVCFELPNHYGKLTARENLGYFAALQGVDERRVEAVLDEVGLITDIDKRVSDFSKGMKNRLNLARSILHRPSLLFLDEPTSGLDPVNARRVRDLVVRYRAEGVTVVITTHDMVTADVLCDRLGFIVEGRLVACDAPDAMKRRYGRREVTLRYGEATAPQEATFPLDGLAEEQAFLGLLASESLLSIHSAETTLEEVFVQVTGRRLR
ncbi:MAG: ABC transporter ATP-binding protein [Myxococcota bacterium]